MGPQKTQIGCSPYRWKAIANIFIPEEMDLQLHYVSMLGIILCFWTTFQDIHHIDNTETTYIPPINARRTSAVITPCRRSGGIARRRRKHAEVCVEPGVWLLVLRASNVANDQSWQWFHTHYHRSPTLNGRRPRFYFIGRYDS
ncbi:hypothetical protein C2E23DRAFT_440168 [Lenzites betulinus]|nr:hypothetical protein C2E23DRAFT_440168 [Lenzites betulinus]